MATSFPVTHAPPPAGAPIVLAARGIRKSFSGVEVLHGVDLTLHRGEVHGLVGQNGAGKSTLVKIIDGAYSADAGEIVVNGVPLAGRGAGESRKRGIAMVFQEFSLMPAMSVGHNILLSREPKGRLGLIDDGETRRQARAALDRIGAAIDPDRLVGELPVGSRQLVEVAKAISQDATILILDEPTSSLTSMEIRVLADATRRLTAEGIAVIFISHHLNEVVEMCDRVTVLRDGMVTLSAPTSELSLPLIIESMLGRSLEGALAYEPHEVDRSGGAVLKVTGLRNSRLSDVSFELHRGEILGIAGLLGSGRTELLRAIFGIDRLEAGSIEIDGRTRRIRNPADAPRAGIALVPEDRARAGLVRDHSVAANILMATWSRFTRGGLIDDGAARHAARAFIEQLSIQASGLDQPVRSLSGGNQQKVVVARNLSVRPSVLLLDDPTVGVDVGSKRDILLGVRELARLGNAILLVSSEFEELAGVADRVLVLRDGRVLKTLDRATGDDVSLRALSKAVQA